MQIKENSIFISDVHYNSRRRVVLPLLRKIKTGEIKVSKLYFMGDIFDFLCGQIRYFWDSNYELIDLINEISFKVETIYFEGNHDFNLEEVFPKVRMVPRKEQPVYGVLNGKKVALAHGDIFTPKEYDLYTAFIRNPIILNVLDIINVENWLARRIEDKLDEKKICKKMDNLEKFAATRIKHYKCDLAIEGHFHQGYKNDKYINLPSFECDRKYMIYQDEQFKFIKV